MARHSITAELEASSVEGVELFRQTLTIVYDFSRGYPRTWDDPGAPDEVEFVGCLYVGEPKFRLPENKLREWGSAWLSDNEDTAIEAARFAFMPDPDAARDRLLVEGF